MTSHHLEDIPPPPYSETDVFSNAGGSRPSASLASHEVDDATQSAASTNGDVIYTPPLTPRSSHQSNFGEVDHLSVSSAAAAYFETRSPPALQNLPHLIHSITLRDDTSPADLPFPNHLLGPRDVKPEDWQTFVNFLIPHHVAASNEAVIDRKLRAERLSSTSSEDARSERSHAEAQLDRIRGSDDGARGRALEATVREWNDGFFAPRRVAIHINTAAPAPPALQDEEVRVPGAWDSSFDQPAAAASRSRFARFNPFGGGGGDAGAGRFRLGGFAIDGDRVSFGNRFVADSNGVRIGSFSADANGVSVNGQPMFGGPQPVARGFPRGPPGGPPRGGFGGFGRGGGFGGGGFGGFGRGGGFGGVGGFGGAPSGYNHRDGDTAAAQGRGGWGRGWGGRGHRGHGCDDEARDGQQERGPEGRRGRRRHSEGHRNRARSSSSSSSSSASSSSSESSVGSLPDYDDLRDSQLPVAKDWLSAWLNNPDQPINRERVKQLKEQIKAAKNAPANQASSVSEPVNIAYDRAAMRKEVKELLKAWRDLKKQQNKARKKLRNERRKQRRDERREEKHTRREMRRAQWDHRRGHGRHQPPSMPGAFPFAPGVPGVPPVPPVPHVPRFGMPPGPPFAHPGAPWGPQNFFPGAPPGPPINNSNIPMHPGTVGHPPGPITMLDRTPGAWPGDEGVIGTEESQHRASQAKYRAADNLEVHVALKESQLLRLHETIALEREAANRAGEARGDVKAKPGAEQDALALEREIDGLSRDMARMRTEADEEFARELAEEERRGW
ncbi:hypothetical protein B0H67DRAFT_577650 [Lasiosphaeris hirsuta]|uniref:Uncharacterized protein n=1 Tax=Lasiosphaeris hirsuta TaxID=260670 RepID=A0AA40ARY2_9PEZI|nr:hypothetical protein B0H67DRAFT_577650 [Lasiosphaeris hirsuta]